MQVWRPEVMEGRRPEVISGRNLAIASALHLVVFVSLYVFAALHGLFEPKEEIIPIDLTVIVNENLDGVENEPPPTLNPPPPPPPKPPEPPKPKPKPKIEPPKALEQIVTNVVVKVDKKEEEKKRKEEEKRKKEEAKKKAEEKRKKEEERKKAEDERLKKMRERAVKNKPVKIEDKNSKVSGNGRTQRQTMSEAEIRAALMSGARAGTSNQLATSEKQRCLSLIKMALEDKWMAVSPKVGAGGVVTLSFKLTSAGGLTDVRVAKSCGDPVSDRAALSVAMQVTNVRGLSDSFIAEARKERCVINYTVRGR